MATLENLASQFSSWSWGLHLVILLIGGGFFFGVISLFKPYLYIGHAIESLRKDKANDEDIKQGTITPFQALATALSSTIGMGNIAGVAVAISIGGPGAIFWMWVSGFVGMITKFFTCTLAVMYRKTYPDGTIEGGPMYYIEVGLGKSWKPLAIFFAMVGLIGALPVFNANQLSQAFSNIILEPLGVHVGMMTKVIFGLLLTAFTGYITLGGIAKISRAAEKLVPYMVFIYFGCVLFIIMANIGKFPETIRLIFSEAFNPQYYKGSPFLGGALGGLMLLGIKRGAFSNEAGIGTAPMAHGASNQKEPLKEGFSAMLGPFIDTIIVCTLTALAIIITDVWKTENTSGVLLTNQAFTLSIPYLGSFLLMICIAVFSISSLFSFSYYGTKCMKYLSNDKYTHLYKYVYLASIFFGAISSLSIVIDLIDGVYALMAIPTMIGALLLSPRVVKRLNSYRKNQNNKL